MVTRMNESIDIECGYCGRALPCVAEFDVSTNNTDIKRVIKVTPCHNCLTDMLEKATELVIDKAATTYQEKQYSGKEPTQKGSDVAGLHDDMACDPA